MENFKNSIKELERADSILNELNNYAIALGSKERGLNTSNSAKACFRALREYLDLMEAADILGTTLPNVLKSYKMRDKKPEVVPEEMKYAPPHWVSESRLEKDYVWVNGKKVEKVYRRKEVTAATAQRLRGGLQAQMVELFLLIDKQDWDKSDKDEFKSSIIYDYRTLTYHEFSSRLCDSLWKLNLGDEDLDTEI